jgi:hypothetical protein
LTEVTGAAPTPDYLDRSVRAYEQELRNQLERYGTPTADPEEVGRRAAVLAAAGQAGRRDAGPFYGTEGAQAALGGVSKQAVSQRVRQGRLLGLRLAADGSGRDRLVYPTWQFHPVVLRHLPTVLAAAGFDDRRPTTGWTIAAWLTTSDDHLGGLAPIEVLQSGHVDSLIELAREVRISLGVDERAASSAGQSGR